MQKSLNLSAIQDKLNQLGLNQTNLAKNLGLTKASISKWMTGSSFPRPAELLRLGKHLGLTFSELVMPLKHEIEPIVAYRLRANCKPTSERIAKAKQMGRQLERLVPYLGFDELFDSEKLKDPTLEYSYIHDVAEKVRAKLELGDTGIVTVDHLVRAFSHLQAVIIPVRWGEKDNHANALHIYSPISKITWVHINLDTQVADFQFWLAHELGHIYSRSLLENNRMEDAENFADNFAGALLFPRIVAKTLLSRYNDATTTEEKMELIISAANERQIAPYCVYKQIEVLASAQKKSFKNIDSRNFFARKKIKDLYVEKIFSDTSMIDPDRFMRITGERFGTKIFKALSEYSQKEKITDAMIGEIFDISRPDAKEMFLAITQKN